MELILKVAQYQSQAPSTQALHTFDAGGGFIGRSASNDWTLEDPSRFISGRHAEISCRDGQFYLTDLSTNGTYLNGLDGAIGKGNEVPLNSGDTIQIGEYLIAVTVEGAAAAQPEPAAPDHDWFDAPTDANVPSPLQPPVPEPMPSLEPQEHDLDWFNEPSEREDEKQLFTPDAPAVDTDDPFAPSQAPEQEFFSPPQAASAGEIPDDWDPMLSQITSAPDFRPPPQSPPPSPSPQGPPPAPPRNVPPAAAPSRPQKAPVATPAPQPPVQQRKPAAPPPSRPSTPVGPAPSGGLIGGLGAPGLQGDPDTIAAEAGAALRILIEGLMEILSSRAQIKDEFRLSQTRIGPAMNNPLKFSPNADEAIRRLFGEGESGFLGAQDGMKQAIDDIKAHQVAMLAGMQAGLQAVLAFFEPGNLERQLGESSGLAAKMPGVREAKLWTHFTSVYDRMAKDAEGDFHRLFGKEFGEAYEKQIDLLGRARRNQGG